MRLGHLAALALAVCSAIPAQAQSSMPQPNGSSDMTGLFQAAVNATPPGGSLFLPAGNYRLNGTITVTKPITIVGSGFGTQVLEQANATLLRLVNVNDAVIGNLYLGSTAVGPGASLIELVNSNHNRIDNVTMLGGYYGLHLQGSLLNTIVDLKSGTNFQGFFAATSKNAFWIYAENFNGISANANTFLAPVLEGGVNGIALNDSNSQGSLTITGGTIEGVSGTALTFANTFLPSTVTGLHLEANGVADVAIASSSNIVLNGLLSLKGIAITGLSHNVVIQGGIVENLSIGPGATRVSVQNVTNQVVNCSDAFVNASTSPTVVFSQIGSNCGAQ